MPKKLLYPDFIRTEAEKIGSDGCTLVADFRKFCCEEHDLAYYYGKDPREAYRHYLNEARDCWFDPPRISREEADRLFRECIQSCSPVKGGSPLAWVRWLGVRAGGWNVWRKHRKERP